MTSCVEEIFKHELVAGEGEVNFAASVVNSSKTRTIYGGINELTGNEKVFWVHGDQITVFGAGCGNRAQADYKVSVNTTNADGTVLKPQQTYANDLVKVGDYGVQWGDVAQTDFYAIYPSTSGSFVAQNITKTRTEDGASVFTTTSATVQTSINPDQTVDFYRTSIGWKGAHFGSDIHNPSGPNALMYAFTKGATAVDEEGNPKNVDLRFYPFTTVLRFSFAGFDISVEGNQNATYKTMVYVNKIKLTAPKEVKIAGDFSLTISSSDANKDGRPDASVAGGTFNEINITPSTPVALETDQMMEFDVFTMPQSYTLSEDSLWRVTLETSAGTFTYKLIPKIVGQDAENKRIYENTTGSLEAGQIHLLSIPKNTVKQAPIQIPNDSWISFIPRNVYLSELSVPGAWYSIDKNYQGVYTYSESNSEDTKATNIKNGLQTLYDNGVRAFHIDCRLTYKQGDSGDLDLYCAGTEYSSSGSAGISQNTGLKVSTALKQIATMIQSDEYVVVVLTIAQVEKTHSGKSFGTVNPSDVLPAIYKVLAENANEIKLYTNPIDSNTLVADVLNHMIVKINMNTSYENFKGYINNYENHYALISEGSMAQANDAPIVQGVFDKMNNATMYWGNSLIGEPDIPNSNMTYYYHHAQNTTDDKITDSTYGAGYEGNVSSTTDGPTFTQRMLAIDDIIANSKSIYESASHNAWFQIGVGGAIKHEFTFGDCALHARVSNVLNQYLVTKIDDKIINNELSPLGIVLMNFTTVDNVNETYSKGLFSSKSKDFKTYGPELVSSILEMNRLFYLNRNPEHPEWPDGNPFDPNNLPKPSSAAASYSSGMQDTGTSAFGWE